MVRFWNNEVVNGTDGISAAHGPASFAPGTPLRAAPPSPTTGEGKMDQ
jgi:hypothetical protein